MSKGLLVTYATRYGSTHEVAAAIADTLREHGLTVDLKPMREIRSLDPYVAVVMGAPLFLFRWHADARRFLTRHQKALVARPVAVFALGPVHDPRDAQEWKDSRAQLEKELASFVWFKPVDVQLLGGRYSPDKLRVPLKMFAGSEPGSDIRDWGTVRVWARSVPAQLQITST